jgi:tRNA (guanine-N7-)-methyltransferase
MKTEAPGNPAEPSAAEAAGAGDAVEGAAEHLRTRFRFSSDKGRADLNPYVDRLGEHGSWVLTASDAEAQRGNWRSLIGCGEDAPLLLEIGPGNGFFFRDLAARFSSAAVLAVEIRFKRVWMTADKARRAGVENFRVIHHHSGYLDLLFAPGELDAVFVNHPDPWPKERHHKHRLLQPSFAEGLSRFLAPGGEVWIKSDFSPFGPLARQVFGAEPWQELAYTDDLHGSSTQLRSRAPEAARFWCADTQTNYERKSRRKGETIMLAGYRLSPPGETDELRRAGAAR